MPTRLALRAVAALLLAACTSAPPVEEIAQALCPAGAVTEGIDVSEYQGAIDWAMVAASGRAFALARVSDGTTHPDATFAANWSGIKAAGMVRGAYQFFRGSQDPIAQADLLTQAVGALGDGDLPAVAFVDSSDGVSSSTVVANLQQWLDRVQAGTGKRPMIYTLPGIWSSVTGGSTAFGGYPLWVANWGVSCPTLPSGWSSFDVWQYSDMGNSVPGVSATVDLDRFNGSSSQLRAFAGHAPTYAAQIVSQSWPPAQQGFGLFPGEPMHATLVLKNVGTATWDANTRLATTQPRDRSSALADGSWVAPDRPAAIVGTVPPGASGTFDFTLRAPSAPGRYDEFFGLTEEGVAWFGDPGQGGPADNAIEVQLEVTAPIEDPSIPDGPILEDAAAPSDAAASDAAAAHVDLAAPVDDAAPIDAAARTPSPTGGCSCRATGDRPAAGAATLCLGVLALTIGRRRRR